MSTSPQAADLSGRRRRLGVSRESMAAGLGMSVEVAKAIEDGAASNEQGAEYEDWLRRIEGWPADVRAQQLAIAGKGRRFDRVD